MKRKLITTLLAAAFVLGMVPAAFADDVSLKVDGGTLELGGKISFTYQDDIPDQTSSKSGYILSLSPTIGYFIIKGLEVEAGFDFMMFGGDLYDSSTVHTGKLVGWGLGARYVLSLGRIAPYLGFLFGMGFTIPPSNSNTKTQKTFDFSIPVGVLIALNQNVGLDLGLRIDYMKGLDDQHMDILLLPVGYMGISAFF